MKFIGYSLVSFTLNYIPFLILPLAVIGGLFTGMSAETMVACLTATDLLTSVHQSEEYFAIRANAELK